MVEIVNSDLFSEVESLEKAKASNALTNDSFGDWPGKLDIEQVRLFNKPFDMTYLLGINDKVVVTPNRLRLHDYGPVHWDGIEYSFSSKTSVGEIFISDNVDRNLRSSCIVEFNASNRNGNKLFDSSGNSNIGILIGDYRLSKSDMNEEVTRDRQLKLHKLKEEDGAI